MNNLVNKGDTLNKLRESVNTNTTAMESHLVDENCHLSTGDRAKLENITENATKVEASAVNGNIIVDGEEVNVYTHPAGTNPHGTTKADVGLGNVDNTSDMDKPISTAVRGAIVSHTDDHIIHITADERTQWNKAEENVQSDWSVSDTASDAFIKNKPSSLPASDVSDWAKEPTKPSYTAAEVGADPAGSANTALESAKSYTDEEIAGLINGAPTTLDTLGEIADAMAENKNVVDALNDAIGTKASNDDLTAHTTNASNPHSVTKSQVGLGNVPNVATNDQTPTFTESSSLVGLTSGDKLSVAFGKISKAVTDFISHVGDNVKHITNTERTNWDAAKTHADSEHAPSDAQANVIETIEVNGTALTPDSKAVNIITTPSFYGNMTDMNLTIDDSGHSSSWCKVETESVYEPQIGSIFSVNDGIFYDNATMSINDNPSKPVYYKGSPITKGVINKGDTATFIYDGSYYHLIAIDRSCEKPLIVSSELTLTSSEWSDNTQTVSVNVDTSRRNVIDVTPSSLASWNSCGVYASSESSTGITFKCDSVPSVDLTFNISSFLIS